MKTTQMRASRDYVFRDCYSTEVSHYPSLAFGRDSKAGREVRKLCDAERECFGCPPIESCWPKEAGDGLTRKDTPSVICWGTSWFSLVGPE